MADEKVTKQEQEARADTKAVVDAKAAASKSKDTITISLKGKASPVRNEKGDRVDTEASFSLDQVGAQIATSEAQDFLRQSLEQNLKTTEKEEAEAVQKAAAAAAAEAEKANKAAADKAAAAEKAKKPA